MILSLCCLAVLAPAWSQSRIFCSITGVETKRLPNAVQVTIQADGLMRVRWDAGNFFDQRAYDTGEGDIRKAVDSLPLRVTNARSQIGSFADVGIYPVSHVEITPLPDTQDGFGVNVRVVLFTPATTLRIRTPGGPELEGHGVTGPTASIQVTQGRRSIIILVTSDRRTQPPPQRRSAEDGGPARLEVSSEDGLLSIDALNADLKRLAGEMARASGQPILTDPGLDRTVSLCLKGVSLPEALDGLAACYGLSVRKERGIVRLTDDLVNTLPGVGTSALESVRLHYISAVSARDSLPEFLLRYLHVNPEENALTVFGPRQLAQKVRQDLAKIDRPLPQVEIEAVVVEFASGRDVEAALGLHTWGRYGTLASDSGSGDIRYDSLGVLPKGFEAALASMEQAGRVRIRARPRAVALNGETAALFVGQQKIVKVVRYDRGRDAYMTRVIGVDVGVKISITPWTGGNGEITARIEPVVSNIAELERASGLPVLSTRQAETTVRVKNGETVAIGGLTLAQNEPRSQKIPILGDLPLIGKLFRSSKPSRKTTETIFFITARTVGE